MGLSASGSQLVTQFFVIYKFLLSLVWIVHFCCFGCFHWSVMLSLQCMLHAVNLYCRIVLFAVATSLFLLCFIYVSTIYFTDQPVCIVFCLLLPVLAVNCRYFYFFVSIVGLWLLSLSPAMLCFCCLLLLLHCRWLIVAIFCCS